MSLASTLRREWDRVRGAGPLAHAQNLARAAALHRADPPPPAAAARAERVVATLTTIPSRAGSIAPTLRALVDQDEPLDAIWLWAPAAARGRLPALPPGVEVREHPDLGPATKLLPALRVAAPDTLLIAVDDDVIYPRDLVARLLAAHRVRPEAALGLRGWRLDLERPPRDWPHVLGTAARAPVAVDVLMATWGLALRADALGPEVHDLPAAHRTVDDVWFSGHLARRGVPRLVIPAAVPPLETRASRRDALSAGPNRDGAADLAAARAFADAWAPPTPTAWLDPWWPTADKNDLFHDTFRAQLEREVGPGHPLFGLPTRLLARGDGDDALFALLDGTGRVASVHLTWSSRQERPPWPATAVYPSLEAWAEAEMRPQHAAWREA
jgi:hypothetical protein